MALMDQTKHLNCCFQLDCNTLRGFKAMLQHYSYGSFDAGGIPSIARTGDEEGVPRLGLDKNPRINSRFVGFSWIGCQ